MRPAGTGYVRPASPVGPIALAVTVAGILGGSAALHAIRPFQQVLGAYTTDLAPRSPEQRHNIAEGARRLDGAILEPGATLSFNRLVGPRTRERGFVPAPAFLEGGRLESIGGGICQVASTLYNAALLAGLGIRERVPHDRVVASVPPGADATVWYGKADLMVANPGPAPVKIVASSEGLRLRIEILGQGRTPAMLTREALAPPRPGTVRVRTVRILAGRREIVSDDIYRL